MNLERVGKYSKIRRRGIRVEMLFFFLEIDVWNF